MITDEQVEAINSGVKHIVMTCNGLGFKCLNCGYEYDIGAHFSNGIPLWLMIGAGWGFTEEHADCEKIIEGEKG